MVDRNKTPSAVAIMDLIENLLQQIARWSDNELTIERKGNQSCEIQLAGDDRIVTVSTHQAKQKQE